MTSTFAMLGSPVQVLVLLILAVIALIVALTKRPQPSQQVQVVDDEDAGPIGALRFRRNNIMMPNEFAFYQKLQSVVGKNCLIFTKVVLWEVVRNLEGAGWNKIKSKHVDFVLCNFKTGETMLVIELDDSSHQNASAQKRDAVKEAILASAGVPLLRVPNSKIDEATLLALISANAR